MAAIDYFAWFVLIVIIVSVVWAFVALARLPGKIAKKRNHPQADAINWAGWLGMLLTLGVVWVLAMVWANMKPIAEPAKTTGIKDDIVLLKARVAELEAQASAAGGKLA